MKSSASIYYITNSIFHWFRQSIIQSLFFCSSVMAYFFILHYFIVLIFWIFSPLISHTSTWNYKNKTATQRKITIRNATSCEYIAKDFTSLK